MVKLNRLREILNPGGFILFNTMILKNIDDVRNDNYIRFFESLQYKVTRLPRVEEHNELIIVEKIN